MSLKIRLARGGAKKRPFYRIVVTDSRMPRDGRFIERLGTYDPILPQENENRVVLKQDRIKFWLDRGAKPTNRVALFLGNAGIKDKVARNNPRKGRPKAKAQERALAVKEAAASAAKAEPSASEVETLNEEAATQENSAEASEKSV